MPQKLAALDLGSNSFRLQIAKATHGKWQMHTRIRQPVRLATFLDENRRLTLNGFYEAIQALNAFHQKLKNFPEETVLATGTFTLRSAQNAAEFLPLFEKALGFPIRVLSGEEEAHYIFKGMQASLPPKNETRLLVDIGGGSTELILATQNHIHALQSFPIGCVTHSARFFKEGKITQNNFEKATLDAQKLFSPFQKTFCQRSWQNAFGSSGSVRATMEFLKLNGFSHKKEITLKHLNALLPLLFQAGDFSSFQMGSIQPDRKAIMPAGFSILCALFQSFGIPRLFYAKGALCQGLLEELKEKN